MKPEAVQPDEFEQLRKGVVGRSRQWGLEPHADLLVPATDEKMLERQIALLRSELSRIEEVVQSTPDQLRKTQELKRLLGKLREDGFGKSIARLILGGAFLRVPDQVDPYGYDPGFDARLQPLLDFLFYEYWRVEVEGVENIPASGGAMLVSNHAGLLPFDSLMIRHAVRTQHSAGRKPRFLIEDWFYQKPVLSIVMNRVGFVRGCPENARALLERDELIGVFPEGVQGISKLYRNRYRIRRFGRGGSIRLAAEMQVPVVPMAVVGSEEIYPIFWRSPNLARVFGLPFFPVTPQFPFLGPLSLMPLPSAWSMRFCKPYSIDLPPPDAADYDIRVHQQNEALRNQVQEETASLYASRRSSFWH